MSEQLHRRLLESTSAIPWQLNLSTACFEYVGPQAETILGYPVNDWYQEHFWLDHLHPDDKERTAEFFQAAIVRGEGRTFEYRMIAADGREIWLRNDINVVYENSKAVSLHGFMYDITERKRADEALKESEARLRTISENSPGHVMLLDKELRILFINRTVPDLTIEEVIGKSILTFVQEDYHKVATDSCKQVFDTGKPSSYLTQYQTKKGDVRVFEVWVSPVSDEEKVIALVSSSLDITERSRTEQRLENTLQKLSLHVKQTPLGVIEWNTNFFVDEWNPAAEKIFGYTREEAIGRHAVGLIVPENTREHVDNIWHALLQNTGGRRSTNENITKNGRTIICEWYNTPLISADGEVIGVASLVDDVTARLQAQKEIHHMAYHDALTGLVNRSEYEQRLQELLNDSKSQDAHHALLYMDLDQFKVINDTCGHAAGDAMLKALTGLLQDQVRANDTLARLGGDEFGILLTGCPLSQAQRVANNIIQAVKEFRFYWKGVSFEIGASMGMVPITRDSPDLAKVLSAADIACYMAKEKGRGRVHIYAEDDTELAQRHSEMEWVSRIGKALEENRFLMYQQEIVPLKNGKAATGYRELLLRLRDDDGQLIQPDQFIAPAERYNLMPSLDRWVIRQAFTHIAMLSSDSDLYSINLSGTSLNDSGLVEYISEQFKKTGLPPSRICFEITETAAISNLARAAALVQQFRLLGCQFSLDDFGKGASSFTYLKNLTVDYLKIDGSFVTGLIEDPTDYAIVESINHIGHSLGIRTIAECVENEASLNKLQEIGVDFVQGYVIDRPKPFFSNT